MAHPMIDLLNEELKWTNSMYLSTGKALGVTLYDVNSKNEEFQEELEAVNRMNNGGITTSLNTSSSDISFS